MPSDILSNKDTISGGRLLSMYRGSEYRKDPGGSPSRLGEAWKSAFALSPSITRHLPCIGKAAHNR